jgi:hypothetical protein
VNHSANKIHEALEGHSNQPSVGQVGIQNHNSSRYPMCLWEDAGPPAAPSEFTN